MLINFSFANFMSYRDEQQFSMQRPVAAQKREADYWERKDISTVAGIYGGNASGKSTFMEALKFVVDFVVNGFNTDYDVASRLRAFKLDKESRQKPTDFLVEFLGTDDRRYIYELSIKGESVEYESLRVYNDSRSSRIFERELLDEGYAYKYGRDFTGTKRPYEQMTRPNVSYLTVLAAFNSSAVRSTYEFFKGRIGFYKADLFECELHNIENGLKGGAPTAKALANLMANANLGITLVQTRDLLDELREFSQQPGDPREGGFEDLASGVLALSQPELSREERRKRAKSIAEQELEPMYELVFTHRGADGFEESFSKEEESRGTLAVLAFFSLALRLLSARSVGLIDEIDSSLHPIYVEELISLFRDPRTNPHQSQLIFSTHDVSLITRTGADRRVLEQDQIWLVEKDLEGASAIYPVTAIQTRWDENFGRNYIHGVYGAAPRPGFHEAFIQASADLRKAKDEIRRTENGGES